MRALKSIDEMKFSHLYKFDKIALSLFPQHHLHYQNPLHSFLDALYVLTSTTKQRFEFIFTDYGTSPTHFSPVFEIYKSYQSTSLYRELKLRGAILTDGQLSILPQEQVYKQLNGVYNLS